MEPLTPRQQVLGSDFGTKTNAVFVRELMYSACRDCAREAHKTLHKFEGDACG